jgi:hypothetical protein
MRGRRARQHAHAAAPPGARSTGARWLLDTLMLLSGAGVVHPALAESLAEAARPAVQRFNAAALANGGSDGLLHLACAATGQALGFSAPALAQLSAYREGARDAASLARAMDPCASDEDAAALLASAQRFLARRVPLQAQLGLC